MERIWKLAVYIFWIVASTALIFVAYILSGNQYNEFAAIMVSIPREIEHRDR